MFIEGGIGIFENAGVPSAGTSEVQTLTLGGTPTGGTFKLAYDGQVTDDIAWTDVDATLIAAVDAALEALTNIGAGNIAAADGTLTSGIGTITLTFGGDLAKLAVNLITVNENALEGTDPTVAVTETTPGVTADFRGAKKGALVTDTTNGKLYINTGTALAPTWTVVGSQS
jgi:hypothetical protein